MEELFRLTDEPLAVDAVVKLVSHRDAGAVLAFAGTVREMTDGKRTLHLEYEAYKTMAERALRMIGEEIAERWPQARTAIHHRVGRLEVSETAVVIAVSTPRRADAYEANRYAIERLKQVVPIWKKEFWADGSAWIGDQTETTPYPAGRPPQGDA